MKKLVLVRRVDGARKPGERDALDALEESLRARGYQARIVEVGRARDATLRDVDALEERVAARFWSRDRTPGRAELLGADAGAVVAKLGADAVVGYHRGEEQPLPLPPPPDPMWGPSRAPRPPTVGPPAGALSVVAASGAAAWFPWGGAGAEADSRALLNAAEAIDAVLAALAGKTDDDGG